VHDVNVTMVGDSIRLFSEPFVRNCLPAKFKVHSPVLNCKSSRNVAETIRYWVKPSTADIVHINCGLHDIRHDPGQTRPVSTREEYLANLRLAFTYLATTGASVIWATTTPVAEAMHGGIDSPRWYQADVVAYNRLSVELAVDFGFRINDLHGLLTEIEGLMLPDGVHFNSAGNRLIGKHVAAAIQACGT
jgi:lysophospholipase L1-like esterase